MLLFCSNIEPPSCRKRLVQPKNHNKMAQEIYCLMSGGRSLTEDDSDLIFETARQMCREVRKSQRVKSKDIEGVVTTSFVEARIGTIKGVKFSAELESKHGLLKVDYIVRPGDIKVKGGNWHAMSNAAYNRLTGESQHPNWN
jgi:hypothetical protein